MTAIVRYIERAGLGAVFDDSATKVMGEAFDAACKDLHDTGQPDIVFEVVATSIIEAAKSGERDPGKLRDWALTAFGRKKGCGVADFLVPNPKELPASPGITFAETGADATRHPPAPTPAPGNRPSHHLRLGRR